MPGLDPGIHAFLGGTRRCGWPGQARSSPAMTESYEMQYPSSACEKVLSLLSASRRRVPPRRAAPMVVFGSLLGQMLAVGSLRRGFKLRRALPFIVGGVLGVPAGAALLPHIDQTVFKAVIG